MTTAFGFKTTTSIAGIIPPAMAVGAHLAAKLDIFCTDERTLTDELCDMLCIWIGLMPAEGDTSGVKKFSFELSKTTTAEEVKTGADLELVISTPRGKKRCLMQAKVLDPSTGKLRCHSTTGWRKLKLQLLALRRDAGDLAYLLVYVPGRYLNGKNYGFTTYEQGVFSASVSTGIRASFNGATVIPVDDLLDPGGNWIHKAKVSFDSAAMFKGGIPFCNFLLELLLCRKGVWAPSVPESRSVEKLHRQTPLPFVTLDVGVSEISSSNWLELESAADQWLGIADDLDA